MKKRASVNQQASTTNQRLGFFQQPIAALHVSISHTLTSHFNALAR